MKLYLSLLLCLQKLIKFFKKILPYIVKLIFFNLNKQEIPARSHSDSIYQKDVYAHVTDVKEHRAIMKVYLDDSINGYEVHARLDDAGPFLPNF